MEGQVWKCHISFSCIIHWPSQWLQRKWKCSVAVHPDRKHTCSTPSQSLWKSKPHLKVQDLQVRSLFSPQDSDAAPSDLMTLQNTADSPSGRMHLKHITVALSNRENPSHSNFVCSKSEILLGCLCKDFLTLHTQFCPLGRILLVLVSCGPLLLLPKFKVEK